MPEKNLITRDFIMQFVRLFQIIWWPSTDQCCHARPAVVRVPVTVSNVSDSSHSRTGGGTVATVVGSYSLRSIPGFSSSPSATDLPTSSTPIRSTLTKWPEWSVKMMTQGGKAAGVQILTVIIASCFHICVSETVLGDICKYGILSNGHRSVITSLSASISISFKFLKMAFICHNSILFRN